jgi:hypothetical protein
MKKLKLTCSQGDRPSVEMMICHNDLTLAECGFEDDISTTRLVKDGGMSPRTIYNVRK